LQNPLSENHGIRDDRMQGRKWPRAFQLTKLTGCPPGLRNGTCPFVSIADYHYSDFCANFLEIQLSTKGKFMSSLLPQLWHDEAGQDIAEYAVMLAVILVVVVGTIRLVGSNANNVFSSVGSAVQ
jgi:Flp pilus assembly pilin Flp